MRAELLGFGAAACGVFAAWDALGLVEPIATRAAGLVAPLRSDREPQADERRRLTVVGAAAAFASGWMLGGPLLAVALAAATPLAVGRALAAHTERRRAALVAAAPAVARSIADALSGGSSIRAALAGAHRSGVVGRARYELTLLERALALGEETDKALERVRRVASHHTYDAIVAAVMLQREAGGDLASLLRRLAATIEEEARAEADARGATAQARYSAGLVACLPLLAAALAELAAPGSVRAMLGTPLSAILTLTAVALQLLAWLVIRKVAGPAP